MIVSLITQHFRDKAASARLRQQADTVKDKGKRCARIVRAMEDKADTYYRQGLDFPTSRGTRYRQDINSWFVSPSSHLREVSPPTLLFILTDARSEAVAERFRKPLFQISCGKYTPSIFIESL